MYASFFDCLHLSESKGVECYHNVLATYVWDMVVPLILIRLKFVKLSKYLFLIFIEILVIKHVGYIWLGCVNLYNRPEPLISSLQKKRTINFKFERFLYKNVFEKIIFFAIYETYRETQFFDNLLFKLSIFRNYFSKLLFWTINFEITRFSKSFIEIDVFLDNSFFSIKLTVKDFSR